jgi:hypothetical protein
MEAELFGSAAKLDETRSSSLTSAGAIGARPRVTPFDETGDMSAKDTSPARRSQAQDPRRSVRRGSRASRGGEVSAKVVEERDDLGGENDTPRPYSSGSSDASSGGSPRGSQGDRSERKKWSPSHDSPRHLSNEDDDHASWRRTHGLDTDDDFGGTVGFSTLRDTTERFDSMDATGGEGRSKGSTIRRRSYSNGSR